MKTTWIVVAQRAGARIFTREARHGKLSFHEEVANAEGRLHGHDLVTDKPGLSTALGSAFHSALSSDNDPSENVARAFAHHLATLLDAGCGHAYASLVLVAEPHFLGLLRAALNSTTAHAVTATLDKELYTATPEEIAAQLET